MFVFLFLIPQKRFYPNTDYILFGHQISYCPVIKIKDSLCAFISYTFAMSNAVQKYMSPSPQIYPLIIDFWIIPKSTVTVGNNKELQDEIGDIDERLREHKLRFIKKCCSDDDMIQTAFRIHE